MGAKRTIELREPAEVAVRLAELGSGLTIEVLHEVLAGGEADRDRATPLHPLNAGGQYAHMGRVFTLRTLLLPHGWSKDDPGGSAMTVSPDGKRQIIISTGDDATGSELQPSTRYPKGPTMGRAVEANKCLWLFPELFRDPHEEPEPSDRATWVLLVRRHETDEGVELCSELSLPSQMTGDYPTEWAERIVIPALKLGASTPPSSSPAFSEAEDIEVLVKRKGRDDVREGAVEAGTGETGPQQGGSR